MWVYRLDHDYAFTEMTVSLSDAPQTLEKYRGHIKQAVDLMQHVGFDGSRRSEPRFFAVPGLHNMGVGVVVQEAGGRLFIGSPIALPHLERHLEWDAYVSDEELVRTRALVLRGEETSLPPVQLQEGWLTSKNGNPYGKINGVSVTVFRSGNRYKAILNPIGKPPVTTHGFITEQDCCNHVLKHFHEIIDPPDEFGGPLNADDEWD